MNRGRPPWLRLLPLLLLLAPLAARGQSAPGQSTLGQSAPGRSVLDRYVEEGLARNPALRRQRFDLEAGVQALREARGRFYPSLSLEARATWAGGGRAVEIPVGELLNDVHDALNTLLGMPRFPTDLGPEALPLLPEREQEARLSVVQPLLAPRIRHDVRLKGFLRSSREAELACYRRLLGLEIREAYYEHLKACSLVELLEQSMELLRENLRVSELLFARGKATEDAVFRARSEIAALGQEQAAAGKSRRLSAAWFNFLLNRDLDTPIERLQPEDPGTCGQPDLKSARARALAGREELRLLGFSLEAGRETVRLAESARLPEISAALTYGIQTESFTVDLEDDFWTASVLLQWQLYSGGQLAARSRQARLAEQSLLARDEELRARIRLEVEEAWADLEVARRSLEAAGEGLNSARAYFDIIARKYEAGISSQMEYMDARNQLTRAEVSRMIARYDALIACARFESVSAAPEAAGMQGGPR